MKKENNYDDLKRQAEPSLLNSNFAKPNTSKPDILDICSGNLDHVNLKQVVTCDLFQFKFKKKY